MFGIFSETFMYLLLPPPPLVFLKGIAFGRRSNRLDLYYSPTVAQPGSEQVPVVVFIYGGAWGSGERSIYCLLAMQMAKELSATVICPDYCTYPKVRLLPQP